MISFRVFGCVIELRFLFVALVTLAVLLDTSSYMRSTLLAAVVHECGHLLVLAGYHALPRKIRFGILNIDMIDPPANKFIPAPASKTTMSLLYPLFSF